MKTIKLIVSLFAVAILLATSAAYAFADGPVNITWVSEDENPSGYDATYSYSLDDGTACQVAYTGNGYVPQVGPAELSTSTFMFWSSQKVTQDGHTFSC